MADSSRFCHRLAPPLGAAAADRPFDVDNRVALPIGNEMYSRHPLPNPKNVRVEQQLNRVPSDLQKASHGHPIQWTEAAMEGDFHFRRRGEEPTPLVIPALIPTAADRQGLIAVCR